ncbi:MAG: polysaccharide biosynthesis/export family protein [Betaproteobacteria bacterium]|nr:polysaccharide biosynthesis/export family protein [Betaproteobacteria bacterium]
MAFPAKASATGTLTAFSPDSIREASYSMKTISAALGMATCSLLSATGALGDGILKLSPALSTVPDVPAVATTVAAPAASPRPVAPTNGIREYRIGEEDLIEVKVFGVESLSSTARVNPRGQVSLPLIGEVKISGLTAHQAEAAIAEKLGETYLQNPKVSLFIKEFTTQRVTVEGAVNKPGIYPLKGQSSLLTSLALAGGPARMAELSEVMLFRDDGAGKRVPVMYNIDRIRSGEMEDPAVLNDDLIVVNRTASRVALRDSLLGDMIDVVNPFRWAPYP